MDKRNSTNSSQVSTETYTNEEKLKCFMCHEFYKEPMILSCSHSFCLNCMEPWLRKCTNCPQCRMATLEPVHNLTLKEAVVEFQKQRRQQQIQAAPVKGAIKEYIANPIFQSFRRSRTTKEAITLQKESIRASQRKPKNIDFSAKYNSNVGKTNFGKTTSKESIKSNSEGSPKRDLWEDPKDLLEGPKGSLKDPKDLLETDFDEKEEIKNIQKIKIDSQVQIREKKKNTESTTNLKINMRNKNSFNNSSPHISPPYPFPRMGIQQHQRTSPTNSNDGQESTFGTPPFSSRQSSRENNFEGMKNSNFQRVGKLRKSYNFIKNKIVPTNKSDSKHANNFSAPKRIYKLNEQNNEIIEINRAESGDSQNGTQSRATTSGYCSAASLNEQLNKQYPQNVLLLSSAGSKHRFFITNAFSSSKIADLEFIEVPNQIIKVQNPYSKIDLAMKRVEHCVLIYSVEDPTSLERLIQVFKARPKHYLEMVDFTLIGLYSTKKSPQKSSEKSCAERFGRLMRCRVYEISDMDLKKQIPKIVSEMYPKINGINLLRHNDVSISRDESLTRPSGGGLLSPSKAESATKRSSMCAFM